MKQLTIGILAKKVSISPVAIRHYEKLGLIRANRNKAKYRLYSSDIISQLILIKNAQAVGFTLKEISELLDIIKSKNATSKKIRELTQNKLNELETKMLALKELQKLLKKWLHSCDGKTPLKKCPILHDLLKQKSSNEIDNYCI